MLVMPVALCLAAFLRACWSGRFLRAACSMWPIRFLLVRLGQ